MILIKKFNELLYEPAPKSFVGWTRIIILSILLYKLLSRDFSILGLFPFELANAYPSNTFNPLSGYGSFGIKYIIDLFTFHFIHWFISFPEESSLYFIQIFLECIIVYTIFFGGGYKKVNYLIIYVLGMYLFGYLFRLGSDLDAIFIQMQIILLLFLFKGDETFLVFKKEQNSLEYTKENGWFFSMVLLIFIGYYFLSGVTKFVDISLLDWARFELSNLAELNKLRVELGGDVMSCHLRDFLIGKPWLDTFGTSMIYLEHILVPILFFKRKYIVTAWFIYLFLHLGTLAVNILFLGVILCWFVFLPINRFYQKVVVIWDGDCVFCKKSIDIIKKFDYFNKLIIISSTNIKDEDSVLIIGWDKDIDKGLWSKGKDSNENYVGFMAIRRILWVLPIFWIFLPFLYLPLVPTIGKKTYNWIAKNRYRFGCNSSNCSI